MITIVSACKRWNVCHHLSNEVLPGGPFAHDSVCTPFRQRWPSSAALIERERTEQTAFLEDVDVETIFLLLVTDGKQVANW